MYDRFTDKYKGMRHRNDDDERTEVVARSQQTTTELRSITRSYKQPIHDGSREIEKHIYKGELASVLKLKATRFIDGSIGRKR
jgi:hypothetical protein